LPEIAVADLVVVNAFVILFDVFANVDFLAGFFFAAVAVPAFEIFVLDGGTVAPFSSNLDCFKFELAF